MVVCRSRVGVYFYPDFNTVIVGLWEDHLLVQVLFDLSGRCRTLVKDYSLLTPHLVIQGRASTLAHACYSEAGWTLR